MKLVDSVFDSCAVLRLAQPYTSAAAVLCDEHGEETLGWSADMKQLDLGSNTADADHTAPERRGSGFVRCVADDMEPSLGAPELLPGDFDLTGGRCFEVPSDQTDWAAGARDDREGDLPTLPRIVSMTIATVSSTEVLYPQSSAQSLLQLCPAKLA